MPLISLNFEKITRDYSENGSFKNIFRKFLLLHIASTYLELRCIALLCFALLCLVLLSLASLHQFRCSSSFFKLYCTFYTYTLTFYINYYLHSKKLFLFKLCLSVTF